MPIKPRHEIQLLITLALVAVVGVLLAGCASFEKSLAYAYATNTAIAEATTEALAAGEISADEARDVAAILRCARTVTESAERIAATGSEAEAQGELAVALAVLAEVQSFNAEAWRNERCRA